MEGWEAGTTLTYGKVGSAEEARQGLSVAMKGLRGINSVRSL